MEFSHMLQRLWRHRLLVALGVVIAAAVAILFSFRVETSPLSLQPRTTEFGAAHMILYVDSPRPSLVTSSDDYETLTARAQLLARLIDSDDVRSRAARRLDTTPQDIAVTGPQPDNPGAQNVQPAAQQRANSIVGKGSNYSVFVDTEATTPTITLYLQAPTAGSAERLGTEVVVGLREYLRELSAEARSDLQQEADDAVSAKAAELERTLTRGERRQLRRNALGQGAVIRTIGKPVGGESRDQSGALIVVLVFAGLVIAWCVALLLISGIVRAIRRSPS
jgi:hypothetical protein